MSQKQKTANRQLRKQVKRVVDDRQNVLQAFFDLVAKEHKHLLRKRSSRCRICMAIVMFEGGTDATGQ